MKNIEITAFTRGKAKDACLYFDRVIPLSFEDSMFEAPIDVFQLLSTILPSSLVFKSVDDPATFDRKKSIKSQVLGIDDVYISYLDAVQERVLQLMEDQDHSKTRELALRETFRRDVMLKRFEGRCVLIGDDQHLPDENTNDSDYENMMIELTNLNLIDTGDASWEQILEARSDESFFQSMRKFRLYFGDHFKGRSSVEIFDNLAVKLDEYDAMAKKHGFSLKQTVMTSILSKLTLKTLLNVIGHTPTPDEINVVDVLNLNLNWLKDFGVKVFKKQSSCNRELEQLPISHVVKLRNKFNSQ